MAREVSFAGVLVAVAVSVAWFYATLALCVATYTATAALVSLLVATCSFCVILCAPGSELPQYMPVEGAASRVLALAPARRLVELWSLGPTVGFVVGIVAVSADGRFHTAFALLALGAAVVLAVPALGGEGVIVAAFTATTWWMAFSFYQIDQTGVSLIAVGIGPPLGLLACGAARLVAAATRGARRCVGQGALLVPPLLLLLALAPIYRSLRPVEKSAQPKEAEPQAPDAKTFITGAHFLKLEAAAKVPRAPNGVPHVVHQTWRSHKLRPDHRAMFDSWSRCLPQGWLHVLWTDAEVEGFVKARAPPAFVRTFGRYKLPIQRIDTFRYVLMATVGGLYADLDNECIAAPELPDVNLNATRGGCRAYVATQACTDTFLWNCTADQLNAFHDDVSHDAHKVVHGVQVVAVQNSLLASAPAHPFWSALLDLANERFAHKGAQQMSVRRTTGVDLISLANYRWNAAAGQSGTRVCPLHANEWHGGDPALIQAGKIRPPRYVLHHGTASWASLQSKSQELCRLLRACPR